MSRICLIAAAVGAIAVVATLWWRADRGGVPRAGRAGEPKASSRQRISEARGRARAGAAARDANHFDSQRAGASPRLPDPPAAKLVPPIPPDQINDRYDEVRALYRDKLLAWKRGQDVSDEQFAQVLDIIADAQDNAKATLRAASKYAREAKARGDYDQAVELRLAMGTDADEEAHRRLAEVLTDAQMFAFEREFSLRALHSMNLVSRGESVR
ncbi:MAG: hypothetical protein D6689_22685 [Deltaproteobacteria bacterium]|nr:MAG: hypothetical protein D6689_22685 [Deltaproteobacteria bacterium]